MKKLLYLLPVLGLAAIAPAVPAALHTLVIPVIDGAQHGTPSPGTGSGTLTYDDQSLLLSWDIQWVDISPGTRQVAFHGPAEPGERGEGQVNIGDITGNQSPSAGDTFITATQGEEVLGGLWYFDVHTDLYPNGEIRGQIYPDQDADGQGDHEDNCTLAANADQADADGDGIGNRCDPDLNNDCTVNFLDLGEMKEVFFSPDPVADLDGDGSVNFADLGILKSMFFGPPGPAADPASCAPAGT